jgi:pSer/pThr/pTyr-binding forkhead associated (FHA) protein
VKEGVLDPRSPFRIKDYSKDARELDTAAFAARYGGAFLLHYGSLEKDEESADIDMRDTLVSEYTDEPVGTPPDPRTNFRVFPVRQRASDRSDKAIWVGRGRQNDIVIPDASISTMHAFIRIDEEGRFFLQDMMSKNGTFVHNQRVPALGIDEPLEFRTGDRIRFGTVRLTFLAAAEFVSLVNQLSGS